MTIADIQIVLVSNNVNSTNKKGFLPGKPVTGKVVVECTRAVQITSLNAAFKGKAKVRWTERSGGRNRSSRTYVNKEKYFYNEVLLLGEVTIGPGTVEVPFSFELPPRLPSTYKGAHGTIEYSVATTLQEKKRFLWSGFHKKVGVFPVHRPVDLNNHPTAKNPLVQQKSHNFYGLSGHQGTLKMTAFISHSGFVQGESVAVKLNVENASPVNVSHIILILSEKIMWLSKGHRKKITYHELSRNKYLGLKANEICDRMLQIVVPGCHEDISTCSIIKQSYYLVVECKAEGFHTDSTITFEPLIMGTIPFSESTVVSGPHASWQNPNQTHTPISAEIDPMYQEPPPPYSVLPPPSAPDLPTTKDEHKVEQKNYKE